MNRLNTGASSYFSRPSNILDPHLFDEDHLKSHVRYTIESLLLDYMESRYNNPRSWIMVWLAGSGISYQWSADRGNGDLDVLFGINYSQFVDDNPEFQWMDRSEIAQAIDKDLKENLWPMTSRTGIYLSGEPMGPLQEYEVTFFLNDHVEDDPDSIVNIHPYAAYNVTMDEWTVKPPTPDRPETIYPVEYENKAIVNKQDAEFLVSRYNYLNDQLDMTAPNTPQWHNYNTSKRVVVSSIATMFDAIHLGRKQAFSGHGEGYSDFYNYQWQAAKRDGIVNAFNEIINREQ